MRRRFGQLLRVGVSAHAVALIATSRFKRDTFTVLAEQRCADASLDTIGASVRVLLAGSGCDGWPLSIVVADDLARLWQVSPPPGAARVADLEGAAALRFHTLYGDNPANWHIAADYDSAQPFMAAAMPRQLLALFEQAAAAHRLKLIEIAPQFVAGWNRWRGAVKAGAWYGLVQDGVLSLGAHGAVRAVALPEHPTSGWLEQQLQREALRLNVPVPTRLMVSGEVPQAWSKGALCTVLGQPRECSPAVRLAATGSAA